MGFHVYILRCSDHSLYIGHTDDLERRISDHETGALGGYTSIRRPITLAFAEEFPTRDEAINREQQLKNWSRTKKEALVGSDWVRLSLLARGRNRR